MSDLTERPEEAARSGESPHPIASFTLDLLERGESEKFLFRGRAPEAVGAALDSLDELSEMRAAILSLVKLAHFLEVKHLSPRAAAAILACIEAYALRLEKRGFKGAVQAITAEVQAKFSRLLSLGTGMENLGREKPEGAMSLLDFRAKKD